MAFVGTIAWSIAEPSYEPIIAVILTGAGLVAQNFAKRKKTINPISTKNEVDVIEEKNNNFTNETENNKDPDGGVKVKIFPESTVFFHDRFCSAFPGVRGIKWFENSDEAIQRLSKLLAKPLLLIKEDGTSSFHPIWWWRFGNLHIEDFKRLDNDTVLLNRDELKIDKIAAVNEGSYYQCFVYVQTKPMEPTGLYQRTLSDIEKSVKTFGYCREEYGLFRDIYKVNREEYDDGAAMIEGQLTDFDGEAELRVRFLTPYNIIIAAVNSPVNNNKFDSELRLLMNGILQGTYNIEDLTKAIQVLPKRVQRVL